MSFYVRMRLLCQRLHSGIPNVYSIAYKQSIGDRVDSRDPRTFQSRLLKFFEKAIIETNSKNKASIENTRDFSRSTKPNKIANTGLPNITTRANYTNEIKSSDTAVMLLIDSVQSLEEVRSTKSAKTLLNEIDQKCCSLIETLSCNDILLLLNEMTKIIPQRITRMIFYTRSIEKLKRAMAADTLTTRQIVHSLFFVSFKKKFGAQDVAAVMKYLPEMEKLSLMEQCVIAQALFKCSVKLTRKEVLSIEETIEKHAQRLVKDPALLVTLSKVLRYSGPTSECTLENLSKNLVHVRRRYELPAAAHALALYAETNTADAEVLCRLIDDSMLNLTMRNEKTEEDSKLHFSKAIRIKDIARLLSAASRLNHKLSGTEILQINEFVGEKLDEFFKEPELLVNTVLSLWMQGSMCQKTLEKCFERDIFSPIVNSHSWRDKAQLDLLLSCIQIEAPQLKIPAELFRETNVRWEIRHSLKVVETALDCLARQMQLNDIKADCPIRGLNIVGLSMKHPSLGWIHVDVLDETTCLRNTGKPHGLMDLKLRLLRQLGCWSVLVRKLKDESLEDSVATYTIIEDSINNLLQDDETRP